MTLCGCSVLRLNMFVTDIQLMLTDWILIELNKKPK